MMETLKALFCHRIDPAFAVTWINAHVVIDICDSAQSWHGCTPDIHPEADKQMVLTPPYAPLILERWAGAPMPWFYV
jgi:hypothetical protein